MRYTPKDFASECPPPRIMGSETEYTVQGDSPSPAGDVVELLFQESGSQYSYNGARIYEDCDQLEYATPESLGPLEATAAEFAGIKRIERMLATRGLKEVYSVYRRSGHAAFFDRRKPVESKTAETSGYHENYLIPGKRLTDQQAVLLRSFLASRIIWTGSGLQEQYGYCLSQKANGISAKVTAGYITRHGAKPMYRIIDLGRDSGFSRLELRCGDPNMSPRMTYLSFAATSLLLRMFHRPDFIDANTYRRLAFVKPYKVLHDISNDVDLFGIYTNRNKEQLTALEHQQILLNQAHLLAKEVELPADEMAAIDIWDDVLKKIDGSYGDNGLETMVDDIDWAAKLFIAEDAIAREKLPNTHAGLMQFDIKWDKLGDGLGQKWWGKRQADFLTMLNPIIKSLVDKPPQRTRAKARVDLQRRYTYPVITWKEFGNLPMVDPYEYDTNVLLEQKMAS